MSRGPRSRQWTVTCLPGVANRDRALPGSAGADVRGVHQFHARFSCRSAWRGRVEACGFFAGLHHTGLGARRERRSPDSSHAGRRPLRAARRRARRRNFRRGRAGRRGRGARRSCRCGAAGGRDRAGAAVTTARHQRPDGQGEAQGRPSANPVHGGAPRLHQLAFSTLSASLIAHPSRSISCAAECSSLRWSGQTRSSKSTGASGRSVCSVVTMIRAMRSDLRWLRWR